MTLKRWIVLAFLVAALMAVQHFGLEPREETKAEAPGRKVAELQAGDILPTYIASLFFGAFRAVAVDVLWIQLKHMEEEKRWVERREVLKLISYFQPRNPEVWSHLGWHSAYNVANGFTDPEKSWEWVKFGLDWLRKGNAMLPDSPHLKFEIAFTLYHKPSWRDGLLDRDLLRRIEQDAKLQKDLPPPGSPPGPTRTAFEIAIPWLEQVRDDLFATKSRSHLTQAGLYLYPSSMDGYIRRCLLLQATYDWLRDRTEEAKEGFRRAQRHTESMLTKPYSETLSPIFKDWTEMYRSYPDLVDLERKARGGRPEDERAYVAAIQNLLVKHDPLDENLFWSRYDPAAPLNSRKQKLARGLDDQECNDSFLMATDINPGDYAMATLDPEGMDVDFYWIKVQSGAKDEHAPSKPPRPVRVRVMLTRPPGAKLDLKATVFDTARRPLRQEILRGSGELNFEAPDYGTYGFKIEPDAPVSPWPADTRYSFQYFTIE